MTAPVHDPDYPLRLAAFQWLAEQVVQYGDVLPRTLLAGGFIWQGERIPLVSPQGIFKPRCMHRPLSITTVHGGPYDDHFGDDGLLRYRYRGNDPGHRDNVGLREALWDSIPLVYFHGIVPGRYLAVWPVYVVGDDPGALTFRVAADDPVVLTTPPGLGEGREGRRSYVTALIRHRLHQRGFRERVLQAYRAQCALCRLRHDELLDAAHIIPDTDPGGEAVVSNGIALCKLHHAAFDRYLIGITPDYHVAIRDDILEEHDGPMLQHGLKALHCRKILLPHKKALWPDRDRLDLRYRQFRAR